MNMTNNQDKDANLSSSDESPHYVTFKHPENLFEIDYPLHWDVQQESDGAIEFCPKNTQGHVGLMLFRTPISIDAELIEQSGRWEEIATAMFSQVGSTDVRPDPTIIYSNYTADRPETDQAGQRWFVLTADLILGISSSCPDKLIESYGPFFERILSSLRIHRTKELLVSRILTRVHEAFLAENPKGRIEIQGLKIITDKFELSIGNVLTQVMRTPAMFDEIVEHFIQGTLGLFKSKEKLGEESWEGVRQSVQPMLKPDKYVQEVNQRTNQRPDSATVAPFLVSAPWLADLRICFALDNQDTFRFVNSRDLERWNVSLETLIQVSIANLVAYPEPSVHVVRLSEEMPHIGALQPSGGASSSYLLHPKIHEIAAKYLGRDVVAAIPSRDALMFFEHGHDRQFLQNAVQQDFATTNHPISDRLFRITPDGIALM